MSHVILEPVDENISSMFCFKVIVILNIDTKYTVTLVMLQM